MLLLCKIKLWSGRGPQWFIYSIYRIGDWGWSLRCPVPCPIGSALQAFSPTFFPLYLVAISCHKSHLNKAFAAGCSLMIFFTRSSRLRTAGQVPAVGSSNLPFLLLGCELWKVPFQRALILPFCLLRVNQKTQTSAHCFSLPKRYSNSGLACRLSLLMVSTQFPLGQSNLLMIFVHQKR